MQQKDLSKYLFFQKAVFFVIVWPIGGLIGCDSEANIIVSASDAKVIHRDSIAQTSGDMTNEVSDSQVNQLIDLPTNVGDPCVYGKCGDNLICMANTCRNMCDLPENQCNEKTSQCGPDEWCVWASTFTGACIPAYAQYHQACNNKKGVYCVQGTLCVSINSQAAQCYSLCKDGCQTGERCLKVSNGCEICAP